MSTVTTLRSHFALGEFKTLEFKHSTAELWDAANARSDVAVILVKTESGACIELDDLLGSKGSLRNWASNCA